MTMFLPYTGRAAPLGSQWVPIRATFFDGTSLAARDRRNFFFAATIFASVRAAQQERAFADRFQESRVRFVQQVQAADALLLPGRRIRQRSGQRSHGDGGSDGGDGVDVALVGC